MIRSSRPPTLQALRAEYEGAQMEAGRLCVEFKTLTYVFKDDLTPSEQTESSEKDLTDRLLRHYVSEGLVSQPDKVGSENRFGFQHLMELLAVRRLQSERALTLIGMRNLVKGRSTEYLYHILTRGARLDVTPAEARSSKPRGNAQALQAIHEIQRSTLRSHPAQAGPVDHLPGILADDSRQWKAHHFLAPGLELVMSEDFQIPISRDEERRLIEEFRACLKEQRHRRPKS